MNEKNPANPKPVDGFNTPNDNLDSRLLIEKLDQTRDALNQGQLHKVFRYLKQINGSSLPDSLKPEFYELQGSAHQIQGQFNKSLVNFQKSEKLYGRSKDQYGQIQACLRLGDIHRQLEQFSVAERWYERAQKLVGNRKNNSKSILRLALDAACGKALCLRGRGRFHDSLIWFQDLTDVYRRKKDVEGQAYAHWALGTTQRFIGSFKKAEQNLKKSFSLYRKLGDFSGLAYARCGWGGTLRMRGLAKKSRQHYAKANKIFSTLNDDFGRAYSFCGQANGWRMGGNYKKALSYFKKAIGLYEKLNQKGPLGFVLWSLAQQQIIQGRRATASQNLRRSQKLFSSVKDDRGLVYSYLGWGMFHKTQNPTQSQRFFLRAYNLAKKKGLLFEMAHAQQHFSGVGSWPLYKKMGVSLPQFRKYRSLP